MTGAVLLLLGATGLIAKMARLIPQSVTAGCNSASASPWAGSA
jgi:MFS superfamily sulfate permease-like transporter